MSRHSLPTASGSPPQHLSLATASALQAIEAGMRRSLTAICIDQRVTLMTYFVSEEEQAFHRLRLSKVEMKDRIALQLEDCENVERTKRFDILFDCECEWETLTGRLGAESFSLVTRKVVEELERRQFLRLALDLRQEREYVHRCEIMAAGLLPGFIREQKAAMKTAWEEMTNCFVEECTSREDLIREKFLEDAPMLTAFGMQRHEICGRETIIRAESVELPFQNYLDITKTIRDEFAHFWMNRVLEYHEYQATEEEQMYQDILLEEEAVCRTHLLIPSVVGGLEQVWRKENVEREELRERAEYQLAELQEKEAVWRVSFPLKQQEECRQRIQLLYEHSAFVWGELYPEFRREGQEMFEKFGDLMRCAVISQWFALNFVATGVGKGIIKNWSDTAFRIATNAIVEREDIERFEQDEPYFEFAELFACEAEELHTRHRKVLTQQIDQVYRIFQKAVIHEEFTARQQIVDVEWENGIIFLYASFHRLWLETVTMGVTRNALKREWERETLIMHEVWIRLGIASRAAFALDSELLGQVREFMPDFDEFAAPLPSVDEEEESTDQQPGASTKSRSTKSKTKDVNALPAVFYIGEDPFDNAHDDDDDGSPKKRKQKRKISESQQYPRPPSAPNLDITPGIVIRYRQHNNISVNNSNQSADSGELPNLDSHDKSSKNKNRSKTLASVLAAPTMHAASGSIWISPESFDVISIRATVKVMGRSRNHAFALLTQFFQITHRKWLEAKYDDWLSSYGDMGYWAHAIEVGLLDQLHNLDEDFISQTEKTQERALVRGSPQRQRTADEHLHNFVHARDLRVSEKRQRKRTVIDALRESLRKPLRPSERKLKPVQLDINPETMCPRPKSSFALWTPSRMTPDELAHYEHNLVLRSAGVEQNPEATKNSRGILPTSRTADAGWNIFNRTAQQHHVPRYHHQREVELADDEDVSDHDDEEYYYYQQQDRNSPGNRPEASVRFAPTKQVNTPASRPASAQTIPRLAPSRLSTYPNRQQQLHSTDPLSVQSSHGRKHHEHLHGSVPNRRSNKNYFADQNDPNVEDRRLKFKDVFDEKDNDDDVRAKTSPAFAAGRKPEDGFLAATSRNSPNRKSSPQQQHQRSLIAAAPNSPVSEKRNNNNAAATLTQNPQSLSPSEAHTLKAYNTIMKRTEYSQKSMPESTNDFLTQSMRPIALMVRPTPPPTPNTLHRPNTGSASDRKKLLMSSSTSGYNASVGRKY